MKLTRYTMSQKAINARIKGGKAATAHFKKRDWVTTKVTRENRDFARARYGCVNKLLDALRDASATREAAVGKINANERGE